MITRCDCFLLLTVFIIDHGHHQHCYRLHCLIVILCDNESVVIFLVVASDIFILVVVFLVIMRSVHQLMNLCAKTRCCFRYNIIGFLCWLYCCCCCWWCWCGHLSSCNYIYIILYILVSLISLLSCFVISSLYVSCRLSSSLSSSLVLLYSLSSDFVVNILFYKIYYKKTSVF